MTLSVKDLSVGFRHHGDVTWVVRRVDLDLLPGKVLAIVGESGSGKSVLARTLVGLSGRHSVVAADALQLGGRDLRELTERDWRGIRGKEVGFIPQDVLVSLDPLRRLGDEVAEPLISHRWGTKAQRRDRVLAALQDAGIEEADKRSGQRSGTLSGGLRQRGLIATATAMDPDILIADEPTTALDPIVQLKLLSLFGRLKQEGKSILIISHDLDFVSRIADEIIVMHKGDVVERGETPLITTAPENAYTRSLIDAVPSRIRRAPATDRIARQNPIFEIRGVSKVFGKGARAQKAVKDASFSVYPGEALGIIGGSGSGKTTLTRMLMGLTAPTSGSIDFQGTLWNDGASTVSERQRRKLRRQVGMIYQDPLGSFDPRWTVRKILEDAGRSIGASDPAKRSVEQLLSLVRLDVALADRHPLRLSGGQRQRVAIARALASNPRVLICDEPVSALDLSVQSQILELLARLQDDLGLTLIIISHDMAVIKVMSNRLLVMDRGEIVEQGDTCSIFSRPDHQFTRALVYSAQIAIREVSDEVRHNEYENAQS